MPQQPQCGVTWWWRAVPADGVRPHQLVCASCTAQQQRSSPRADATHQQRLVKRRQVHVVVTQAAVELQALHVQGQRVVCGGKQHTRARTRDS
jgi:hypothetical protein